MEILEERNTKIDRQKYLFETCRSVEAIFDRSHNLGIKRPTKTDTNTDGMFQQTRY